MVPPENISRSCIKEIPRVFTKEHNTLHRNFPAVFSGVADTFAKYTEIGGMCAFFSSFFCLLFCVQIVPWCLQGTT